MGIFKKINFGLRKTRNNVSGAIDNVLDSYTSIDQELFDELEEALVMGDVGVTTASEITLRLNDVVRKKGIKNPADVKAEIKDITAGSSSKVGAQSTEEVDIKFWRKENDRVSQSA